MFAAPEDWSDTGPSSRIERAATGVAALVASAGIARQSWSCYQHTSGINAGPPQGAGDDHVGVDLDTDLQRLATGG